MLTLGSGRHVRIVVYDFVQFWMRCGLRKSKGWRKKMGGESERRRMGSEFIEGWATWAVNV